MNTVTGVHLIGSVPLPDAATVFRTVAHELGPYLARIPLWLSRARYGPSSWATVRNTVAASGSGTLPIRCTPVMVFIDFLPPPVTPPPLRGGGWGRGADSQGQRYGRTPPPNPLPQGEGE